MKNKSLFSMLTLSLLFATAAEAADCKIFYVTKNRAETLEGSVSEVKEIGKVINRVLKESYQVLYKIDRVTLGLASAIATGGTSLEDLKPAQWDKFNFVGNVVYQDSAFSGTALRGAKLTFSTDKSTRTIVTGAQGEFAESFSKLVPYSRLRLFPAPIFEMRTKTVPTVKVPMTVKLESKLCNAQTTLDDVPLEPLIFIATTADSPGL